MRRSNRHPLAGPVALAALVTLLTAFAAPVLAKENLDAQLEAPIARDTPGGTTLLLRVWVTMTDQTGTHDVEGSPVYVRLTGRDGETTRALATQGRAGRHTVRAVVPDSGVRSVEVGFGGTTDLPLNLVGFSVVPGPISAKTAQVAPAIAAASPPPARASVPAPRALPAVAPAGDPTTSITPSAAPVGPGPVALIGGVAALAAAALAVLAIVRRVRLPAGRRLSGRPPEA